jgi:hypothetical protein
MMGHKSESARTTERYARFRPNHLGHAVQAIDAYFADLKRQYGTILPDVIFNPVRASSVLVPELEFPQSLEKTGGRYWDRTSDPCDVNTVLYR